MNIKTIGGAVVGGVVGWKVADRFSSQSWVEVVGALAGAYVGYMVGKKL